MPGIRAPVAFEAVHCALRGVLDFPVGLPEVRPGLPAAVPGLEAPVPGAASRGYSLAGLAVTPNVLFRQITIELVVINGQVTGHARRD